MSCWNREGSGAGSVGVATVPGEAEGAGVARVDARHEARPKTADSARTVTDGRMKKVCGALGATGREEVSFRASAASRGNALLAIE
jgi:hypothetical protein